MLICGFTKLLTVLQQATRQHLSWLFRVTTTRPVLVLALTLLLLLPAGLSLLSLRFETDIFRLFPSEKGHLRLFLDSLSWTGDAKQAYFLLEGSPEILAAEAESFAARLTASRIDGQAAFSKIAYRVYDPAEAEPFARFMGYAVSHPHLFLAPRDGAMFRQRFSPDAVERELDRTQARLAGQLGMGMADLIAADPLTLRELILPRLKAASQALSLDPDSPYFLSRDGMVLIMIGEPARPVNDMAFARKLVAAINAARQDARVDISCTGAHLSAVIDEAVMKRNIIVCVISSLLVVLGLFYLTYRRLLPTLLLPFILFYGVTMALATAGLFLPTIHIISFAFTALIIGLGTDYSIHLYDRFHGERAAGRDTREALRLAMVDTGHGVFTAAVTTALPFLALAISPVRALAELGLLVGLGVLFCLYATLVFLPPLLLLADRQATTATYKPLPCFGLGRLWRFCRERRRLLRPLSLALVTLCLVSSFFLTFDGELKNLQPKSSEAFQTQEKMEKHLTLSRKQLLVAVEGDDLAEVMTRGGRVSALAEQYRRQGRISAWSALDQVINGETVQEKILRDLQAGGAMAGAAVTVADALERTGFAAEPFQPYLDGLAGLQVAVPVPPGEAVKRMTASPLHGIVDRHLVHDRDGWHLLVYLHYNGSEFPQEQFLRDLAALDPDARTTSVDLVSSQLTRLVRDSFFWSFLLGGAVVLCLLLAHFKSLFGSFATLFPVVAGVIAMTGIMAASGMGLNFMNAMVLVTILGMGSDYGLHLAHRVGRARTGEEAAAFAGAGRAVLLSVLTTIAGFGSLAFTDYGAMSSIGWATNYGVGATALFALVFLPAFFPGSIDRSGLSASE